MRTCCPRSDQLAGGSTSTVGLIVHESGDPYFEAISSSWSDALRNAFHSLPDYSFYSSQAELAE